MDEIFSKAKGKKCENLFIPASPLPFIFVPSAFDKNPRSYFIPAKHWQMRYMTYFLRAPVQLWKEQERGEK
jgi:hypothetical protein